MVAHCDALVNTALIGNVHCIRPREKSVCRYSWRGIKSMMPIQNTGTSAQRIAATTKEYLESISGEFYTLYHSTYTHKVCNFEQSYTVPTYMGIYWWNRDLPLIFQQYSRTLPTANKWTWFLRSGMPAHCQWDRISNSLNRKFAEYLGVRYAFGVSSASAALELAAMVSGIGENDEVILPCHTFTATALPFMAKKSKPRFLPIFIPIPGLWM